MAAPTPKTERTDTFCRWRLGEAPHPGLRLGDGLYRRLVTGSLSGVPKSALPDFPV